MESKLLNITFVSTFETWAGQIYIFVGTAEFDLILLDVCIIQCNSHVCIYIYSVHTHVYNVNTYSSSQKCMIHLLLLICLHNT